MPFALTVFMHAYACIEIKKIVGAPPKIDARVLENQRYFLPWPSGMNLSGIASQFAIQNRSSATQKSQRLAGNCDA